MTRNITIRWSRPVKDKVPVSAVIVPAAHLKRYVARLSQVVRGA